MTQTNGQNARTLFSHLRKGNGLSTTPSQPLVDDRDANGSDTNVFASDREITVADAVSGPALCSPSKNAIAIDFWANPIAQSQIRDYNALTLHSQEVTRHAEHILERNTKWTFIDLVGICTALLRFAERSIYMLIQKKEGDQGAQQFDLGYNGVMAHAIQPLHAL
ncbi:MAG: hypothetical protein EZS28_038292 [Streblomastix strix]|uniref:Uncharacterized protein n=1 Tax=Streblomastix strix TaxID=222440 RepID=A0A5J4U8E5_9EUKA|nr:MAG: hypothetical protein EZS28_038292 [Streblomastix strix]